MHRSRYAVGAPTSKEAECQTATSDFPMATPQDAMLLLPGLLPPGWAIIPGCPKEEGSGTTTSMPTTTTTTMDVKKEPEPIVDGEDKDSKDAKDKAESTEKVKVKEKTYTNICLLHMDLDMETWRAGCDKVVVMTPEKNSKPRRSRTHFWSYVIKDLTAGGAQPTTTPSSGAGRGQSAGGVADEGRLASSAEVIALLTAIQRVAAENKGPKSHLLCGAPIGKEAVKTRTTGTDAPRYQNWYTTPNGAANAAKSPVAAATVVSAVALPSGAIAASPVVSHAPLAPQVISAPMAALAGASASPLVAASPVVSAPTLSSAAAVTTPVNDAHATAVAAGEDILQEALSSIDFEFEGEDNKPIVDVKPCAKMLDAKPVVAATPAPTGDTIFSPAFLTVAAADRTTVKEEVPESTTSVDPSNLGDASDTAPSDAAATPAAAHSTDNDTQASSQGDLVIADGGETGDASSAAAASAGSAKEVGDDDDEPKTLDTKELQQQSQEAEAVSAEQHSIFAPAMHPMTMYNYGGVPQAGGDSAQPALFPYATTAYAAEFNGQTIVNPYALSGALSAGGIPFTYVIAANPEAGGGSGGAAATATAQPAATASNGQQQVAVAASSGSAYPSFLMPFGAASATPLIAAAPGPGGTVTYYAPQPAGTTIQTDPSTGNTIVAPAGAIQVLPAGATPWATTIAAGAVSTTPDPNAVTGFSDVTSSQQPVGSPAAVALTAQQHASTLHSKTGGGGGGGSVVLSAKKRPKPVRSPLGGGSISGGDTGSDPGTPDGDVTIVKRPRAEKLKSCGTCVRCVVKENCNTCYACQNRHVGHQICKMRKCEVVERMQRELKNEHARRKKQRQAMVTSAIKTAGGMALSGGGGGVTIINAISGSPTAVVAGLSGAASSASSPEAAPGVVAPPGATAILAASVTSSSVSSSDCASSANAVGSDSSETPTTITNGALAVSEINN